MEYLFSAGSSCIHHPFYSLVGLAITDILEKYFSLVRRRGRIGEDVAVKLLKKNGYRILQSPYSLSGKCIVDDKLLKFNVRVDYLFEQYGVKYLAGVTTGKAADPKNVSTWRQLFAYAAKGISRVAEETLAAGYNVAPKVNLANPKDKPFRQRVGPAAKIIEAGRQRIFKQFLAEPRGERRTIITNRKHYLKIVDE